MTQLFQSPLLMLNSSAAPPLPEILQLAWRRAAMTKDGARISLFTVIATFGTAQNVTTGELRVESLFRSALRSSCTALGLVHPLWSL